MPAHVVRHMNSATWLEHAWQHTFRNLNSKQWRLCASTGTCLGRLAENSSKTSMHGMARQDKAACHVLRPERCCASAPFRPCLWRQSTSREAVCTVCGNSASPIPRQLKPDAHVHIQRHPIVLACNFRRALECMHTDAGGLSGVHTDRWPREQGITG